MIRGRKNIHLEGQAPLEGDLTEKKEEMKMSLRKQDSRSSSDKQSSAFSPIQLPPPIIMKPGRLIIENLQVEF